jgi:hypothetical protein
MARDSGVRNTVGGIVRGALCWTLVGLSGTNHGASRRTDSGESLERLQGCRREIPTTGRQYFESPCTSMRLGALALSGISRATLEATLDKADYCFEPLGVSGKDSQCLLPGWAFFCLPAGWLGGGPHLVCSTGGEKACRIVYWMFTA